MSFNRYLRLSSMFLVITGFYSILITGTYIVPVVAGVIAAGAYALMGERLGKFFPIPRWVWNIAALLFLAYFIYDSFFASLDLIGNGIKFVVYLQIVKLLSPKTNRDWMQIFALSFLHLISSTALSSDITFALPFLVYIVLATWTLAMFTIKLAQEDAVRPERKEAAVRNLLRTKDIITQPYLAITSLLSVAVIAITLMIFFTFPRLSLGHFFKRIAANQTLSGFSEQVELGTIGNIKTNDTIAFRVEMAEETIKAIDTEMLYWRATATDNFNGRRWKQSMPDRQRLRIEADAPILDPKSKIPPGSTLFQYNVFLEALSTPIIFGADRLYRVTWEKPLLERLFRGSIAIEYNPAYQSFHFLSSQNYASDLSYHGESYIGEPTPSVLREEEEKYPFSIKETYLQLPLLHPDVKKLLAEIPMPNGPTYDRVRAVIRFLEENYRYTLDVQDAGTSDPLRFFLVERKQGHCEYFSTALIMALRFHGIPARQVVGFRGGDVNLYGNYLAVRQRDAHAWTEVYFPKSGWIRFDPSPLDSTVSRRTEYFRFINQFVDYLRLRWNKYIIEYDLRAQAGILERMGRKISQLFGSKVGSEKVVEPDAEGRLFRNVSIPRPLWMVLILSAVAAALYIMTRRMRRHALPHARYAEVLKLLEHHGYRKSKTETAKEFVRKVENKEGKLPPLHQLTRMYYEERFGRLPARDLLWTKTFNELKAALSGEKIKNAA